MCDLLVVIFLQSDKLSPSFSTKPKVDLHSAAQACRDTRWASVLQPGGRCISDVIYLPTGETTPYKPWDESCPCFTQHLSASDVRWVLLFGSCLSLVGGGHWGAARRGGKLLQLINTCFPFSRWKAVNWLSDERWSSRLIRKMSGKRGAHLKLGSTQVESSSELLMTIFS